MKEFSLSDLICPAILAGKSCRGQLALCDNSVPIVHSAGDSSEVLEGIVSCRNCRNEYPIICGVLLLAQEIKTYLVQHYSEIMSIAVVQGISKSIVSYLQEGGYELHV